MNKKTPPFVLEKARLLSPSNLILKDILSVSSGERRLPKECLLTEVPCRKICPIA